MTKWEYKVLPVEPYWSTTHVQHLLNMHGHQGWELVSVSVSHWYFKRPEMHQPQDRSSRD